MKPKDSTKQLTHRIVRETIGNMIFLMGFMLAATYLCQNAWR